MAVDSTDLVAPRGRIELGFFPGEDEVKTNERLEAYLAEGRLNAAALNGATADAAVTAWAYYRAYQAIYTRLSITPYHAALNDQGSRTYSQQQIKVFQDLANAAFAEYQNQFPVAVDTVAATPRSVNVPLQVVF